MIASLLSCLLGFFFFVRFVVRDFCWSGCRHNFFFIFLERPVRATPNHKMEANSSVHQKDKTADGTPRRLCVSHSFSMGPISAERGRVISGHLAKWFGTNTKLLREVIKPISTPNNYLNTAFKSTSVSLCGSCRNNAIPRSPREKL